MNISQGIKLLQISLPFPGKEMKSFVIVWVVKDICGSGHDRAGRECPTRRFYMIDAGIDG